MKYYYHFSVRAGAVEGGPSVEAGKITATAEPECRSREGTANKQLRLSSLPADLLPEGVFYWPKSTRSQPTTKNGKMMQSTIYKTEQREAENKWCCVCMVEVGEN